MAKKIKTSSLITQPLEILDDIPQLITDSAIEYFPLLKKADVDLYLQIALLKQYFEKYYFLDRNLNHDNKALEVMKNNPEVAKSVTNFLKGFHKFRSSEVFASKEEMQIRLQKQRNRRLSGEDSDKFEDFKNPVNLYASFMNLNSSISSLDDEKTALDTAKRIFVLFNQALPYYSRDIRGCFDLEQLFVKFERIRQPFFGNLSLLFSEALAAKNPEFLFLKQAQLHALCAAMMWINHTKIINSEVDTAIFFVLDTLFNLLPDRFEALMFADYSLEETDIIAILPSPLNMIAVVIEHYQNKKNQKNEENKKLDHLLNSLQTIKNHFIAKFKGNFLQHSLRQEFIFFLDKLLDFVLSTNETGYRAKIMEYYNRFLPLIEQLINLFKVSNQTNELDLLNSIKIKWDNFINENNFASQISQQKGSKLINEEETINTQIHQEKLAEAREIQEKADEKGARILAEKREQALQEEAFSAMKIQERLAEAQMSPLEQIQIELLRKIFLSEQNVSREERFNIKERNAIEEICKCLKIDPMEEIDKNSLIILKDRVIASEGERSLYERHKFLILSISLVDNYLSRVTDRITYYKKYYAPSLKRMTERHGKRDFDKLDHETYRKIQCFMEPALKNLMLTGVDCDCLLTIFEMINGLRGKIENKEFYRLWDLAAVFRKEEHSDLYKSFLENVQQFKTYRKHRKIAFKTSLLNNYKTTKKNNTVNVDGKTIDKILEGLISAIAKITEILAKNDEGMGYLTNVSILREDQLRETQLQTTVIDENKVRKPIEYNPHERFRRSQSFYKLDTTKNDVTEEVNFSRRRTMSL